MDLSRFKSSGDWLKHADLPRPYQWVSITGVDVKMTNFDDRPQEEQICVVFDGELAGKQLALNVTNRNVLFDLYGYEGADWVGKMILLYRTTTEFSGKSVMCIRLAPFDGRGMSQPFEQDGRPVMFDIRNAPGANVATQQQPKQPPSPLPPQQLQTDEGTFQ